MDDEQKCLELLKGKVGHVAAQLNVAAHYLKLATKSMRPDMIVIYISDFVEELDRAKDISNEVQEMGALIVQEKEKKQNNPEEE